MQIKYDFDNEQTFYFEVDTSRVVDVLANHLGLDPLGDYVWDYIDDLKTAYYDILMDEFHDEALEEYIDLKEQTDVYAYHGVSRKDFG